MTLYEPTGHFASCNLVLNKPSCGRKCYQSTVSITV
nr:MAG TPA: hypothetical protein [Caudoviricetes sp.]